MSVKYGHFSLDTTKCLLSLTLYALMDSSFWFDTMNLGWSSVETKESQQDSKIEYVRSYLRVHQAAGQVKILIFLVKIIFPHICQ